MAKVCFEQPGYWRECLPAQKDTQGNLGLQAVCVKCGADVASDHHLLIAKL